MEGFFIYFLGILAYNLAPSIFVFGVAFALRLKRYPITWMRGGAVLLAGWLLGSVIVFLVNVASKSAGVDLKNTANLEILLVVCVLFPVMFLLLDVTKPKPLPAK
jgi:hypothetical protein